MSSERIKLIKTASIISICGNLILAVLKIVFGIIAKSNAVLADGIDSSSDVLISIVSLAVVGVMSKPADVEHPFGHRRAETIATAFLSFVLFFSGAQLVVNSVSKLINGGQPPELSITVFIVTVVSILGKLAISLSQSIIGKRANSQMLIANAKNMTGDILISSSVLVGLVISLFSDSLIVDSIIAMLIGLWVVKTSVNIFMEVNIELMDGNTELEPYRIVFEAVSIVDGAFNPHRARMRKIAGMWDIDFDIHVDPTCSITKAHNIARAVEDEIMRRMDNILEVVIHVEPMGDIDDTESFGLTEELIETAQE
ncbi:MAG: cation diffusion facilitator family transporter [Oscillospiraceae bacterium]|nr:cation diffusion facilitator family transporter [Oscillospiraceae bacterium]